MAKSSHAAVLLVMGVTFVYALIACFGLGDVEFWGDEGIVALGAKRTLHFGYPKAWDGVNLFSFEAGHDLSDSMLQRRLPWLSFYLGALGMALFGENHFGARFIFTLCGIVNLPLTYGIGRRLGLSRKACVVAVGILAGLAAYFLYIRQSYHYAPDVTLCLLTLGAVIRIENRWNPFRAVLGVLALFHLNYLTALWLSIALLLWMGWERKINALIRRPEAWGATLLALVGTWGWIRWASVLEFQDSLGGWGTLLPHWNRLAFVLSELDMSFPLFFTLPVIVWLGWSKRERVVDRSLFRLGVCVGGVFLYFGAYEYAWLRFFLFLFVVLAWIWAVFLVDLWERCRVWAFGLAAVMFATTLPYHLSHACIGAVWPAFARFQMQRVPPDAKASSLMARMSSCLSPMLVDVPVELSSPPVTPLAEVIHYLKRHAHLGEQIVSLCDSEILAFSTPLKTAYLVDPRQESSGKVRHLPGYVSSYEGAHWILLRNQWKRNFGMRELAGTDQNAEILAWFDKSGIELIPVRLKVRERFPNQLPMLWGHTWSTDLGGPTMQLYQVKRKKNLR